MTSRKKYNQGYIALLTVLIIGALALIVGIGSSLRSLGGSQVVSGEEFAHRALALANACAEDAIVKLKGNLSYAGGESVVVDGSDACDILNVEGTGSTDRVVNAEAFVSGYKKKVKVVISEVTPTLTISSWREVAEI